MVALLLMAYVTAYRNTGVYLIESEDFGESMTEMADKFLSYSTLPFVLFDRSLTYDYFSKLEAPYYGRATFAGLDLWAWIFLRNIIDYEHTNNIVVDYLQENFYPISNTSVANYAYTGLLYHYLDFGYFGIFLFPLLFGYIYRQIIHQVNKRGNIYLLILSSFCYFMMLHSVFTNYFNKPWTCFYIAALLLLAINHRRTRSVVL